MNNNNNNQKFACKYCYSTNLIEHSKLPNRYNCQLCNRIKVDTYISNKILNDYHIWKGGWLSSKMKTSKGRKKLKYMERSEIALLIADEYKKYLKFERFVIPLIWLIIIILFIILFYYNYFFL